MRNEINSYNTKLSLAKSLKDLLETKSFAKLTVTEIIKKSEVNRNTFYYHFEDIYDLLRWTLEQEAIDKVKTYDSIDDIDKAIDFTLDYIKENQAFLRNILFSVGERDLKRFLAKDFKEIIKNFIVLGEARLGKIIDDSYRSFLTDYTTEAIAGILTEIITKKDPISKDRINYFIQITLTSSLTAAINNYVS
ncbi:TetR/AcrR family transcriptional regulator C-terminal domain-containing protein [uncultured Anaerococcus sp.]|uniref:TetR/AcrR family transcriptional regulator C-terminal domain-containing protein n=1 Tax=uncultured Anaerococcus sp. TaxID=293428 RepID=UPI00260DE095|nr:TetR/AcrR family transcriptional regulator C-terminal domain-containing protein [uncultured Anaerococcus sp.]